MPHLEVTVKHDEAATQQLIELITPKTSMDTYDTVEANDNTSIVEQCAMMSTTEDWTQQDIGRQLHTTLKLATYIANLVGQESNNALD